ncbi:hypothetical protein Desor_0415 [Desulfosporosinus orientis DSM 765]|uniref:Uncharacterized protein n=1 Tax=Desulfosporosinus orientis (strain ATCC 19365 / DSM 765 / NCIMB 8382 / VKM B-1628 / Singapore I) TaxID=768706 RepID=G7W7Q4_DESOD|nr:hypothetical protein Desor_0415 [Desulfosporosinus orientis DSM 765]
MDEAIKLIITCEAFKGELEMFKVDNGLRTG